MTIATQNFLIVTLVIMVGIVLAQNSVVLARVLKALETVTNNLAPIGSAIIKQSPEPVQEATARLETLTDIAKEMSIKKFGKVDENKVTQFVSAFEAFFDRFAGEGDSEVGDIELTIEETDTVTFASEGVDNMEVNQWLDDPKPSADEDKQPDDQKPTA